MYALPPTDGEDFTAMVGELYRSGAAVAGLPAGHAEKTFCELMSGSPYADAYIAETEGRAAGYILLALTYSNEAGGAVLWIDELYVREDFRRQGLGAELIRFAEGQYAGHTARVRLEAEPNNTGAMRLYKRLGFEPLGYIQLYKEQHPEEDFRDAGKSGR